MSDSLAPGGGNPHVFTWVENAVTNKPRDKDIVTSQNKLRSYVCMHALFKCI